MGSSSVITLEDVLESLMNDGTINALKLKIINQLKANVSLSIISFIFNLVLSVYFLCKNSSLNDFLGQCPLILCIIMKFCNFTDVIYLSSFDNSLNMNLCSLFECN
ncbi:hypothetical protein ES288_D08G237100v1 [Gossypium darwinii]|uniref:Uncharacterized protein n=2 Tax=Gossypium TaxID=3633 RepID=A0A5D2JYK1_GOSTO|nr:hypothetical protein ES288_D08G237100v1 [Gossypium darwinii]TYH59626.1 hypothetical protein ES332_D08G235500v1 [Gossypium tomentosum]